jgi:transcriptional regulator with XRE-family HTH domain
VSALSDALSAANKSGLSARAVSRVARERGHSLNHDTAARYLRGDHGLPDEATLIAFADVLHVSLSTLRRAAGLPADETAPYTPPAEASRLTRRQRRAVDEIIRAMLDPGRSVTDISTRRRTSTRRAARHGDVDRTT